MVLVRPAREAGLLPSFPFGTDFTDVEQRLIPALQLMKEASAEPWNLLGLAWQGLSADKAGADVGACLSRLALDKPQTLSDRFYQALVAAALARTAPPKSAG